MKYAKFISETNIDRNLPHYATWQGRVYTGDLSAIPGLPESLGFLPLDETAEPETPAPEGSHYEARYAETDGRIAQSWIAVADPPAAPRVFSKLKIKGAIATAGLLTAFKQLLEGIIVAEDYTAAEAFNDAANISEAHPGFAAAVTAAKAALGVTDEQVEAILAAATLE